MFASCTLHSNQFSVFFVCIPSFLRFLGCAMPICDNKRPHSHHGTKTGAVNSEVNSRLHLISSAHMLENVSFIFWIRWIELSSNLKPHGFRVQFNRIIPFWTVIANIGHAQKSLQQQRTAANVKQWQKWLHTGLYSAELDRCVSCEWTGRKSTLALD